MTEAARPGPASSSGRLFLALWPGAGLRTAIARACREAVAAAGGRPVPPVDYHLTLAFLGSADAHQRAGLTALAAELVPPRCTLWLDRFGHFRGPAVFWLGPSAVPPLLAEFAARLWKPLSALGYAPDGRPFRPHVTLCRKVREAPGIPVLAAPLRWPVRSMVLAESVPLAGQPGRYRIIARPGI